MFISIAVRGFGGSLVCFSGSMLSPSNFGLVGVNMTCDLHQRPHRGVKRQCYISYDGLALATRWLCAFRLQRVFSSTRSATRFPCGSRRTVRVALGAHLEGHMSETGIFVAEPTEFSKSRAVHRAALVSRCHRRRTRCPRSPVVWTHPGVRVPRHSE